MASAITKENIGQYLTYVGKMEARSVPDTFKVASYYNTHNGGMQGALADLYKAMNIPQQRAWSHEDGFLQKNHNLISLFYNEPSVPEKAAPKYNAVNPYITLANYKGYIEWLGRRKGRSLELPGTSWQHNTDEQVHTALHNLYSRTGVMPHEATIAENDFANTQRQQFKTKYVYTGTEPKASVATPPQSPAPQPAVATSKPAVAPAADTKKTEQPKTYAKTPEKSRGSGWGSVLLSIVLILLLLVGGGWTLIKYKAYRALATIYPLTDNIAVRLDATEDGQSVDRMDMYGESVGGEGGTLQSKTRYKLADDQIYNGFYKVMADSGFSAYLFKKTENELYVNTRYVTTDEENYEMQKDIFSNLRGSYNDLDKLNFNTRQAIVNIFSSANEANAVVKLAAPCTKRTKLGKDFPLTMFKFQKKANDELIVIFQSTDGKCYYLKCAYDGQIKSGPSIVYTYQQGPLQTGGEFVYKDEVCTYTSCDGTSIYKSVYPYINFYNYSDVMAD